MPFEKGKTPEGATPFKPGVSGNPAGKPLGTRNRNTIAKQILNLMVQIPDKLYKKYQVVWPELQQKVTTEEMMSIAAAYRSLKRDMSYKVLMDSAYGAPKQEVDMVGEIKITDHKLTIEVVTPKEEE